MGKCLEINIEDVQTRLQGALENYFDENEVLQNSPALIQDIVDFYFSLKETNSIPEDPEQLDNLVNSIWEIFYQYGLTSLGEVFYSQETILTYLKNILTENINERLASVSRLVDTDVELSIMNASTQFLDEAYGSAKYVRLEAERSFKYHIFNYCFINRYIEDIEYGLIGSNTVLNQNIVKYQQFLVDSIISYLESIDFPYQGETTKIYNKENGWKYNILENGTTVLDDIIQYASSYLSPKQFSSVALANIYRTATGNSIERTKARALLNAYNALIALKHFDTFLYNIVGDLVYINKETSFNRRNTINKYQLSAKTADNNTAWRLSTTENILKELDKITKLAIETTRVYKNHSTTPSSVSYLDFTDFTNAIVKLKALSLHPVASQYEITSDVIDALKTSSAEIGIPFSKETEAFLIGKTLKQVLDSIKTNPVENISYVFELLANKAFQKNDHIRKALSDATIQSTELDTIWTLYYTIFGKFSKGSGIVTLQSSHSASKINYYEYITHTVNTIYKPTYGQYYKNEQGKITYRLATSSDLVAEEYTIRAELNSAALTKQFIDRVSKIKLEKVKRGGTEEETINIVLKDPESKTVYKVQTWSRSGSVEIRDYSGAPVSNIPVEVALRIYDNVFGTSYSQNDNMVLVFSEVETGQNLINLVARAIMIKKMELALSNSDTIKKSAIPFKYLNSDTSYLVAYQQLDVVRKQSVQTLSKLAYAKRKSLKTSLVERNKSGEGNDLANVVLSRLIDGPLEYQISNVNSTADVKVPAELASMGVKIIPATKQCLLVRDRLRVYRGVIKQEDYTTIYKETKNTTEFSEEELTYASFMLDFIGGLVQSGNNIIGNGNILLFPCTISDKPYDPKIRINLTSKLSYGDSKTIQIFNPLTQQFASTDAIIDLIHNELGTIFKNQANNILAHYKILFHSLADSEVRTKVLQAQSLQEVYSIINEHCNNIGVQPISFIKNLVLDYNYTHPLNTLSFIEGIHYRAKKTTLEIDPTLDFYINTLYAEGTTDNLKEYFKEKQLGILSSLLRSNFSMSNVKALKIEDSKDAKNNTRTAANDLFDILKANNLTSWISSKEELILGKVIIKGKPFDITSKASLLELVFRVLNKSGRLGQFQSISSLSIPELFEVISNIYPDTTVELNPLFATYNMIDMLYSLEFQITSVGSLLGHPGGKEAEKYNAQNKRNNSFTASMYAFQTGTINSTPTTYNIAIVDSYSLRQGTIDGSISKTKPWDGGTLVDPVTVYLENYALGGNRAGITKKPFIHSYNPDVAGSIQIKTAGMGLTLNWARNSREIQIIMQKMMDSMEWFDRNGDPIDTDITTDFNGKPILYQDMYFKEGDKYYKIESITKVEGKPNTYLRAIREVTKDGRETNKTDSKEYVVNTNWKLLQLFGGVWSMKLKDSTLVFSETAVENLVEASIRYGIIDNNGKKEKKEVSPESQDQVWQPLKHSSIHYLCDSGAVKTGAANINSYGDLFIPEVRLNFSRVQQVSTGVQLDKEHNVDNAEVSMMTQVISAATFKGYTTKEANDIYESLLRITEISTADFAENIFTSDPEADIQLRNVIVDAVIKSLKSSSNNNSFASIIAKELIAEARRGKRITFNDSVFSLSDQAIYSKLVSTITAFLTKNGIKQKLPGTLSVMTMSQDILKIIDGTLLAHCTDESIKKAQERAYEHPIFTIKINDDGSSTIINRLYNINIGTTYFVTYGSNEPVKRTIETHRDYLKLKQEVKEGKITNIFEDIVDGRQLGSYNVRFSEDGNPENVFQLYDLDIVGWLIDIQDVKKISDVPTKLNKFLELFGSQIQNIKDTLGTNVDSILSNIAEVQRAVDNWEEIVKNGRDSEFEYKLNRAINAFNKILKNELELTLQLLSPNNKNLIIDQFNELLTQYKSLYQSKKQGELIRDLRYKILILTSGRVDINSVISKEATLQSLIPILETQVSDLIKNLYNSVRIDGRLVQINRESINIQPYEIVMAKTFKTKYGLEDNVDLRDIVDNQDYFLIQYLLRTKIPSSSIQYDIAIKRVNGGNIYLLDSSTTKDMTGLTVLQVPILKENGKCYRLDRDNILYEVPEDAVFYTDRFGNEYIQTANVDQAIDCIDADGYGIKENVEKYLEILSNSKNRTAKLFAESIKGGTLEKTIQNLQFIENIKLSGIKSISKDLLNKPFFKQFIKKHTSFLQTLEVIAGRTPSQSKQSFMPMKIIAYDNPDINNAYVSTMQLLLQGSDYDIDAVTITTFDVNDNGIVQTWSPYSRYNSLIELQTSMELPFPNGRRLEVQYEQDNPETQKQLLDFLEKYKNLFKFSIKDNKLVLKVNTNYTNISEEESISPVAKLRLLAQFLEEINNIKFIQNDAVLSWIQNNLFKEGNTITTEMLPEIFQEIVNVANKHNTFLENMSSTKVDKALNNHIVYRILQIAKNPGDLLESQVGLDDCTEPFNTLADDNLEEQLYFANSGPGNFLGKIEAYINNQIGKGCVGIGANGLKLFSAITTYVNNILNSGDPELQASLVKSSINFMGTTYYLPANARALNVNTLQDPRVLEILASRAGREEDAALTLSAILSLAVDNAKNLKLAKINGTTAILPLYIYGAIMGIPLAELVYVLNSRTGRIISELIQGNSFISNNPITSISQAILLLRGTSGKQGGKNVEAVKTINNYLFNKKVDPNVTRDVLDTLSTILTNPKDAGLLNTLKAQKTIGDILATLLSKKRVDLLPALASGENITTPLKQLIFNMYIANTEGTLSDIQTLSRGSKDCRKLQRFLKLNQGLPNTDTEVQQLVNTFNTLSADIDLKRFVSDEQYRKQMASKGTGAINILGILSSNAHFLGYLKSLSIANESFSKSFLYRASDSLYPVACKKMNTDMGNEKLRTAVYKGTTKSIQEVVRNYFLQSRSPITIPSGNSVFTSNFSGRVEELQLSTAVPVRLGTELGNATFKKWIETEIIPNLKKGNLGGNVNVPSLRTNEFIRDLATILFTNTSLGNGTLLQTLPVNMIPRETSEFINVDKYRQAFIELSKYNYVYTAKVLNNSGQFQEVQVSIPLIDIFTYYTLIAHKWTQNAKSLLQMFADIYNQGIIKDYTKFMKELDEAGQLVIDGKLTADPFKYPLQIPITFSQLLPNVVQKENPIVSTSFYIKKYHRASEQYRIYKRKPDKGQTSEEEDEDYEGVDIDESDAYDEYAEEMGYTNPDDNIPYEVLGTAVTDTKYLELGQLVATTGPRYREYDINVQGTTRKVLTEFTYNEKITTKGDSTIKVPIVTIQIRIDGIETMGANNSLKEAPLEVRMVDGRAVLSEITLISHIESVLNPC